MKEPLINRRKFFAKASKKILPILGVVLTGPSMFVGCSKDEDTIKVGCDGCMGTCTISCTKECSGGCYTSCRGVCIGGCSEGCKDECREGCLGTCADGCEDGCRHSCFDTCWNACKGCTNTCKTTSRVSF